MGWIPVPVYFLLLACDSFSPDSKQRHSAGQVVEDSRSSSDSNVDSSVDSSGNISKISPAAPDGGVVGGLSLLPHIGNLSDTTAIVWVRLSEVGRFRVLYQSAGSSLLQTPWVSLAAERDFTGTIKLPDLLPATTYTYAVEVEGGRTSPVRSFTTLYPPGQGTARVGLIADGRSELRMPVYGNLARADLDMVLQIGDFDHRDPYDVGGNDPQAWWDMYRDLLGVAPAGVDLQRLLLPTTPLMLMWDDHDYGSDNGSRDMPYRDVARAVFAAYSGRAVGQNGELWTRVSDGPLDIFMLDLRSHRDNHAVADGPDKSMLGEAQWNWLTAQLLASTAPFKLVVSTVPFNPTTEKTDAWYGFENERRRLLSWLERNRINNVVIVSGDIHTGGAIDDGTHSGVPELNLPTMNMGGEHCTSPTCGSWSEGVYDDYHRMGYGVVDVRFVPAENRWVCTLSTFDLRGNMRHSLRLPRPG